MKQLSWRRRNACSARTVGFALARGVVVCASLGEPSHVRAISETATVWEHTRTRLDGIQAAGDVVLVYDADRMGVLDARDGKLLRTFTSDDGGYVRAAALDIEGMTLVITVERNRIVARLPRVDWTPAWAVEVNGVVRSVERAGDGVLVTLEDGDGYRMDGRTGQPVALSSIGVDWHVAGDRLIGSAPGGPVPPERATAAPASELPAPNRPAKKGGRSKARAAMAPSAPDNDDPPRLMVPVAPPAMAASWQSTLYNLDGVLRARNEYALESPVTPGARSGTQAPIVVESGHELLVLDPDRGDPLRRIRLPDDAKSRTAFSTVVDGKPVVGVLLANPLRVLLF